MAISQIVTAWFSPTGTTRTIVTTLGDMLSADLNCPIKKMDFTLPEHRKDPLCFNGEDLVILGVPVIAGRVPNVLLPYLKTMVGGDALAIPIVLYGNRNYDDALIELQDLLEDAGAHTVAAAAFIGEHSFSKVLGGGRPDAADLEVVHGFAQRILLALRESNFKAPDEPVAVSGTPKPYRPYYVPRDRGGKPVNILKVKPITADTCIQCGHCAAICPMGSIDFEDCRRFTGICIKCGACVKGCPVGAKGYDDPAYLYHQNELEEGYTRRAEPHCFIINTPLS